MYHELILAWQRSQSTSSLDLSKIVQSQSACKASIAKLSKGRKEVKCPDEIELMNYAQVVEERRAVKFELAHLKGISYGSKNGVDTVYELLY
jgi:hypothetical protein